ncbi:MAG: RimK family alpha-L-glutamate ligase [Desulfobacterales bacterium]|nr:RimK family alpha-L-glutamate ligase [Desulfobacterales bacterium]
MYGWILHDNTEIAEIKRATDEAAKANVTIELVYPKDIELILEHSYDGVIYVRGVKKQLPEFAIAAFLNEVDYYNLAILRQLETLGVLCINTADAILNSSDKLLTSQLLISHNIPVAKTALLRANSDLEILESEIGLPMIAKVMNGSKGKGVILIQTKAELKNLLELYVAGGFRSEILLQTYIASSKGKDLRVFIIGGKALACFIRQNASDGFKSNISVGGFGSPHPLTDSIKKIAEKVAKILGLNMAGIDLMFGPDGYIVGEANSLPGFQGLEAATGINVPVNALFSIAGQLISRPAPPWRIKQIFSESMKMPMPEVLLHQSKTILPGVARSLFNHCQEAQNIVLFNIINFCRDTEFGKGHNFYDIKSIDDFRERVPISSWPDYEIYAQRMANGEKNILFPGAPEYFITTSGTTSNKLKMIPESNYGAIAKKAISLVRRNLLFSLFHDIGKLGHFFALSNSSNLSVTPAGIPIGFASGITRSQVDASLSSLDAYPSEILNISDNESVDYLIMRFALHHKDMMALIGNNAGRMRVLADYAQEHAEEIISDIEKGTISKRLSISAEERRLLEEKLKPSPERAAELRDIIKKNNGGFLPKHYWPQIRLACFWLSSTVGNYIDDIRPLLNDSVIYMDAGYGSSELKINIPMKPNESFAPIAPFVAFFEFLPIGGIKPLLAHELTDGSMYELIITTYSGLYRYNIQDLVKVCGFTGNTPNIEFVIKSIEVANISDEKIPGSVINSCVRETASSIGISIKQCQVYPDQDARRYVFLIEPEGTTSNFPVDEFLIILDKTLKEQHMAYRVFRGQKLIHQPVIRIMRQGWQESLYREKIKPGITTSQIKLPYIISLLPDPTWFLKGE